jgi:hypothetical protein
VLRSLERKKTARMSITGAFLGEMTNSTSLTINCWMDGYTRQRLTAGLAVISRANYE